MMRGRCQVSGFGGQEEACDELPAAGSGPAFDMSSGRM